MENKRQITPEGFAKIEKELQDLWHKERPRIVQEVSDAAAMGDRSENAEYIYGKKKLREIDRRVRYLSQLTEKLEVVDPKTISSDKVEFGATVIAEDEDGNKFTYQIVGQDEIDAKRKRISPNSPIGKALLNKRVSDVVLINRPAGELELEILEIRYE